MASPTNKVLQIVLAVVLAILALAAFVWGNQTQGVIATSMAVQIPEIVAMAIRVGLVALLTAGFTWVFNVFGLDLRGTSPVIALAISAFVIFQIQGLINLVPLGFEPILNTFFYYLTLLLTPAGALWLLRRPEPKSPQLM